MSDDIIDTYDRFAVHYRALLQPREHFRWQRELLLKLFRFHGITPSARILDAACGTGDVLADLNQLGFRNLMGIDGSAVMLRKRNGWRCLAK
jgi:ubiquinone/menaquinone biosynthesis C-methylase UbiE